MSGIDHPETEEEYEQRRRELIESAAETKRELDERQNEALEAIAEGQTPERYDTVTLGELDLEVLGWLPGDVEDKVVDAMDLADDPDPGALRESKETIITALDEMTVSDDYNGQFWREYHRRYGQEGLIIAANTVFEPAKDGIEERRDAVDGFRKNSPRAGPGVGVRDDGPDTE